MYAIFLGKPLIANVGPAVCTGVLPNDNTVYTAKVYVSLIKLEDVGFIKITSIKSKVFDDETCGHKTNSEIDIFQMIQTGW